MTARKNRPSQQPGYRKWHSELKARNPETWLAMIRALPRHLQNGVARLVWWDYFADRSSVQRWTQLDWCLNTHDEPEVEEWQQALIGLGYPEAAAVRRVNRYQKFFGYTDDGKRKRILLPNGGERHGLSHTKPRNLLEGPFSGGGVQFGESL